MPVTTEVRGDMVMFRLERDDTEPIEIAILRFKSNRAQVGWLEAAWPHISLKDFSLDYYYETGIFFWRKVHSHQSILVDFNKRVQVVADKIEQEEHRIKSVNVVLREATNVRD